MHAGACPSVMAGAALAAASLVAVAPVGPRVPEIPVASIATRLVDATDSILNVPVNLLEDLVNVPANELHALDTLAASLIFGDNWFAASPANLWGIDPGDPPKIEAVVDMLVPFSALSGMGSPEFDYSAGLGQQIAGLAAAELPVNAACALDGCLPFVDGPFGPPEPITGITGLDNLIWLGSVLSGQTPFPLVDDWLQVPLTGPDSLLSGYTFDSSYPGFYDAGSPSAYPDGYGFLGTVLGPDGTNLVPWANTTFTLNPLQPFENFLNSLMAPPTGLVPFPADNVPAELLAALSIAFDPYAPGVFVPNFSGGVEPLCPATCTTEPGSPEWFVSLLQQLAGANNVPLIDEWLSSGRGTTFPFGFGNITPLTPDVSAGSAAATATTAPLTSILTALGGQSAALASLPTELNTLFASFDPSALSADLAAILSPNLFATTLSPDLFTPILPDLFGTLPADLSNALSADLSTLLADLGTNLPAVFSTLPADLLSLF